MIQVVFLNNKLKEQERILLASKNLLAMFPALTTAERLGLWLLKTSYDWRIARIQKLREKGVT